MNIDFTLIYGLSFGLEYIPADEEIEFNTFVLDIACFRWVIELTDE